MPSSKRTKEFVFKTLDEYSSLAAGKISNDNHTFVNPNDTRSRSPEICAKSNLENSIDTPRDFPRASECAQMIWKQGSAKQQRALSLTSNELRTQRQLWSQTMLFWVFWLAGWVVAKLSEPDKSLEKPAIMSICFYQQHIWENLPTWHRHRIGSFRFSFQYSTTY